MKSSLCLSLLAAAFVNAHYKFPDLIYNGQTTGDWQYVRQTANYQSNGPVTDVTSTAIRCYEYSGRGTTQTMTVKAGSQVGFTVSTSISHPGPLLFYMAKAPSGQTAASWDGSGNAWFKIYEQGPQFSSSGLTWPSEGKLYSPVTNLRWGRVKVSVTIPASVPSGDYLLRVESIALHSASTSGGAQFYLACGQITVTGGGSGNPGPLVAFPGAYKATDPGILINIYYPVPTNYTFPGPPVWTG